MKLDILAAFNTNSRCLIRIRRSWGLIGSKNRKHGLEFVIVRRESLREQHRGHYPGYAIYPPEVRMAISPPPWDSEGFVSYSYILNGRMTGYAAVAFLVVCSARVQGKNLF